MGKYKRMKIFRYASYLVLRRILYNLEFPDGLNKIKGLGKFTDLGIERVHLKDLLNRALVRGEDGLGFMLTEKGLCYFEELKEAFQ